MNDLYEHDFYRWTVEQSALLRAGKLSEADIGHIAEEIESMGRSERRELTNRLAVLLGHLLKWRHQAAGRGASWQGTIREQRRQCTKLVRDNPSLRACLGEALIEAYGDARELAADETGLAESTFPSVSPWSVEDALDRGLWPD